MHLFALTGGIASGKSSVAKLFEKEGVSVVDADVVAREVVRPGTAGLASIVDRFGTSVLTGAGELDRAALARLIFGDDEKRRALNAILHPLIAKKSAEEFAARAAAGATLVCYDAALLVENGLAEAFRPLVVVDAPVELRIERARARDAASADEVEQRIRAQASSDEKRALADYVIDNVGSKEELEGRAREVLQLVRARLGAPR